MWSESYRPRSLGDMVGNDEVREKLLAWLSKWKKGGKAVMLVGPPGTGKTTTVQLAAKKLGLNLVQLNAGDRRTKQMLAEKLGEALQTVSLFGERTLVFLDEVDGLAGRADYGAVEFIRDAVRGSQNPIVMAANDAESDEVRKLSSVATSLVFVRPSDAEVAGRLVKIAAAEGVEVSKDEALRVAASANGDIRSAINSLQGGAPGAKDIDMTASQSMGAFFGADDRVGALAALRAYPGQPREKVRDAMNSVARSKVHPARRAAAADVLSRADVLLGRMVRGGDWRLLRYLDQMLATELREALGDGGVRYSADATPFPVLLRIWNDSKKLKDIGGMVGRRTGESARGSLVEDMPFLMLLCRDGEFRSALARSLSLEENYVAFVEKESARTARFR